MSLEEVLRIDFTTLRWTIPEAFIWSMLYVFEWDADQEYSNNGEVRGGGG